VAVPKVLEPDDLVTAADMVPEEPTQFTTTVDTIIELCKLYKESELVLESVVRYAIEHNAIPEDGEETQAKWQLQNLQLTSEQAAYAVLYGPSRLNALRFRTADEPGFFATLQSWLTGTAKYRKNWCGSPELFLQTLPAPSEVAYFAQVALAELATFVSESKDRGRGRSYDRAIVVDAATARPASLHHGTHQKLLLFFTAATTITLSGAAELRIKAQLFATHRDQPLPPSDLVSARGNDAVHRYTDASELGGLLLGDSVVQVAVHPSFHTFERGVVDEVSLVDLAAEVKAAFVAMLDAFQSTMLSQCDDLALEVAGDGGDGGGDGGDAAAAEGVLINFDD
tara:strand:+ start:160 stop:1179 length:1020 start_codon:yes stop_codon:yes gene_type:complete